MGNDLVRAGTTGVTASLRIDDMASVFRLADALSRADGFVPKAFVGRPEAIAAAILTGAELGLGPMESMRSIHMVEGRPTMSAELMLARARSQGVRTWWVRTDAEQAVLEMQLPGDTRTQQMAYTMADAQRAGLAGRGNWSKFPANMLRARCTSAAIRAFCPEVLGASGVYEADSGELSDGVPSVEVRAVAMPAEPVGVVATADVPPALSSGAVKLQDVSNADELRDWCRRNRAAIGRKPGAIDKVAARAEALGVERVMVDAWLNEEG